MSRAIIWIGLGLLLGGCDVINPEEEQVAYIEVSEVSVNPSPIQGANTEDIRFIYMFKNGLNFGGFPTPATIPILGAGEQDIVLSAAVRVNGQSRSSNIYPFYERVEISQTFEPLEVLELPIEFEYVDDADFGLVSDFEFSNQFVIDYDGDPQTGLDLTSEESASGSRSGLIELNNDHRAVQVANALSISNVPNNGTPVYIEMDYMTNVLFSVGLVGISGGQEFLEEFIFLKETDEWRKVYLDVTELIRSIDLTEYRILLSALHPQGQQEPSKIFIDNIKFIHFQ